MSAVEHVVEQYAHARVVTDVRDDERLVPVVLRYDAAADPRSVRIGLPGALPGAHEWIFARDLLERGLRAPADDGDVRVWPCGRAQAVLELRSPRGVAVVQCDTRALVRFLGRTYATAPVGS
ncbi:SsgA family sporulation/cell division regulator [Streptomyces minutiscleroticus]|uniref:SsgA family sporulation/cell division regulator n=1 Tax=Streptomyces minutiscleroticus TaxID=68238 RepID=UPI0033290DFC